FTIQPDLHDSRGPVVAQTRSIGGKWPPAARSNLERANDASKVRGFHLGARQGIQSDQFVVEARRVVTPTLNRGTGLEELSGNVEIVQYRPSVESGAAHVEN